MNAVRIAALALLAAGILMLVLDVIENLIALNWNGMAMSRVWALAAPASMAAVENFIEGRISVALWQQILLPVLALPAWVALLFTGVVFWVAGKRLD
jgi:hypothetical protein